MNILKPAEGWLQGSFQPKSSMNRPLLGKAEGLKAKTSKLYLGS
ncbi:hypothetical protein [Bacteroides reticulotermitis]|uniref:Uncharacterized protein n=1 Tax=Bacteroides reticulotermitis TaxID=1133319 RepID=A0A840D2C8_9BACE|nr:hypothetical protein [Bacteroides reticulotermitis]MBB4044568.1 hypothetical protein [Bacteroides reticulotermitis]